MQLTPTSRYRMFPEPQKVLTWSLVQQSNYTILIFITINSASCSSTSYKWIKYYGSFVPDFFDSCNICEMIQVVACISSSFIFIAARYSAKEIHHNLCIHSPVDGHLGYLFFGCCEWSCHEHFCTCLFSPLLLIWKKKLLQCKMQGPKKFIFSNMRIVWLYVNLFFSLYVNLKYYSLNIISQNLRCHWL